MQHHVAKLPWTTITTIMDKIKDEVGDLLFSCVNIARFLNVDEELALNSTIDKFIKRFSYIEEKVKDKGLELRGVNLDAMNKLWEEAKKLE